MSLLHPTTGGEFIFVSCTDATLLLSLALLSPTGMMYGALESDNLSI